MRMFIAALFAGIWVGAAAPSAGQEDRSTPEVIRAAVRSVADELTARGHVVIMRIPDHAALAAAMSKAGIGLPTGRSKDVVQCASGHCTIVGGTAAIAIEAPEMEGPAARMRVWVVQRGGDPTGIARQVWEVELTRRGRAWVVARKELVFET